MSKFENELKYVNLDKTIELFGDPSVTRSKVVAGYQKVYGKEKVKFVLKLK